MSVRTGGEQRAVPFVTLDDEDRRAIEQHHGARIPGGRALVALGLPSGLDLSVGRVIVGRALSAAAAVQRFGYVLERLEELPGPATLRAALDREEAWRDLELRYGLLTAPEVAERVGSRSRNQREYATALHRNGRALAVRRGSRLLFPGFQFGPDGRTLPGMVQVLETFSGAGWSEESVALWFTAPQGFLDDREPAVVLPADPAAVVVGADGAVAEV